MENTEIPGRIKVASLEKTYIILPEPIGFNYL